MDDQEIYKLILKVENADAAARLSEAVEMAEQDLAKLIATLGKTAPATRMAAASLGSLQAQLKEVHSEAGITGQKMMQFGNIIDDLQYVGEQGLRPIINNVMQLSPVLGTAMIGVQLLYNNWDKISELWGGGQTKTEAEEMEELGKKTEKTAQETAKLLSYEQLRKNINAQNADTKAVSGFEKDMNEAIAEGPKADIAKGIEKNFPFTIKAMVAKDGRTKNTDDELAAAQRDYDHSKANNLPGSLPGGALDEALSKAKAARKQIQDQAIDSFLGGLARDPEQAKKVADAVAAHPGDFGPGATKFAQGVIGAQPENQQTPEDKAFVKRQQEAYKEQMAKEKERQEMSDSVTEMEMEGMKRDQARMDQAKKDREQQDKTRKDFVEKGHKAAEKRFQQDNPGLEGAMQDILKRAMMGGMTREQAEAKMRLNGESAADVHKAGAEAQEELMKDWIKGPKIRSSEITGSASLADSVQSGVGGDRFKEQLQELRKQTAALDTLVRASQDRANPGRAPARPLVFGANGQLGPP